MNIENRIDFVEIISVKNANPNGDPSNNNQPRQLEDGRGEISDVCIKRKIRNRLQDMGEKIFVQATDRNDDGYTSLSKRATNNKNLVDAKNDTQKYVEVANAEYIDVRAFGQVFAFKGDKVSVGIRGSVTVQPAFSVDEISITTSSITKSTNGEDKEGKAADTMGEKHRVDFGVYVIKGSINARMAEKNGLSEDDVKKILYALKTLFVNDETSARPAGSMNVEKLFVFRHNKKDGNYSYKEVFDSVKIEKITDEPNDIKDYHIYVEKLDGLNCSEM